MVHTDLVDTDDENNFDDSNIIAESDNNIPVQKSPNDMTSITGKYCFNYIYSQSIFEMHITYKLFCLFFIFNL